MPTATIEIECSDPKLILDAVDFEKHENLKFTALDKILKLEMKTTDVKGLIKTTYSTCNKIQLALDAHEKFCKE